MKLSPRCRNCGRPFQDSFCRYCGSEKLPLGTFWSSMYWLISESTGWAWQVGMFFTGFAMLFFWPSGSSMSVLIRFAGLTLMVLAALPFCLLFIREEVIGKVVKAYSDGNQKGGIREGLKKASLLALVMSIALLVMIAECGGPGP